MSIEADFPKVVEVHRPVVMREVESRGDRPSFEYEGPFFADQTHAEVVLQAVQGGREKLPTGSGVESRRVLVSTQDDVRRWVGRLVSPRRESFFDQVSDAPQSSIVEVDGQEYVVGKSQPFVPEGGEVLLSDALNHIGEPFGGVAERRSGMLAVQGALYSHGDPVVVDRIANVVEQFGERS